MRLKELNIQHENYYSDKPSSDRYKGKVSFFNEKGESLGINLREDQIAGIVEICAGGIITSAKEAAQSIVASVTPDLQIEHSPARQTSTHSNESTTGATTPCLTNSKAL